MSTFPIVRDLNPDWQKGKFADKPLKLIKADQITGTPFEPVAVGIHAELHAKGWITGTGIGWDHKAIGVVCPWEEGRCIAMMAFYETQWRREVNVSLGGVLPDWRREGLYRALFAELVEHVKRTYLWAASIGSGYHVDNEASRIMHERLGRAVTHHSTTFPL